MSQTLAASPPAVVLRTRYVRLQSLLALACAVIAGLSIAVVLIASSNSGGAPARAVPARTSATAETGARLDHRGLHDAWYLFALRETGARLDHRGLRVSPKH